MQHVLNGVEQKPFKKGGDLCSPEQISEGQEKDSKDIFVYIGTGRERVSSRQKDHVVLCMMPVKALEIQQRPTIEVFEILPEETKLDMVGSGDPLQITESET